MRAPAIPLASPVDPEGSSHARGVALDPAGFVVEMDRDLLRSLARLGEQARAALPPAFPILELLSTALRDEIEAAEVAALWMTDEPDLELKLGLALQVGDEASHFRLMADRIRELGGDPTADPRTRAHSPAFRYLRGLQTPAERLAAGIVREGVGRLRNGLLAELSASRGDAETARICREVIGPDEARHLDFGRRLLPRYALTVSDQEAARRAMARTLQLAEEAIDASRTAKAGAPPAGEVQASGR
jgi:1,2-phenylacetyl-CoA epoxidase catalytic subunit